MEKRAKKADPEEVRQVRLTRLRGFKELLASTLEQKQIVPAKMPPSPLPARANIPQLAAKQDVTDPSSPEVPSRISSSGSFSFDIALGNEYRVS